MGNPHDQGQRARPPGLTEGKTEIPRVTSTILTGLLEIGVGCFAARAHITRMSTVAAGRPFTAAVVIADLASAHGGSAIAINADDLAAASPPNQRAGVTDGFPRMPVSQKRNARPSE
jgi:hypothetical protein